MPKYNKNGSIDLIYDHPTFGAIPFTASQDDVETLGRELFSRALAGDFGMIEPYVESIPEKIARYEKILDDHLDAVAKADRWDSRFTFAMRAGYPNEWQSAGRAFGEWMDACNSQALSKLNAVLKGIDELPSESDFIDSLPIFTKPEV